MDKVKKVDKKSVKEFEKMKKENLTTIPDSCRVIRNPHYFTRFKEFKKLPPSNFEVPIIRNASPYQNEDEKARREFLESKRHWLSDRDFAKDFGKATTKETNYISNYVNRDPSPSPLLH